MVAVPSLRSFLLISVLLLASYLLPAASSFNLEDNEVHHEEEGTLIAVAQPAATMKGFITYDAVKGKPYSVTYDKRSLKINGEPSLFLSGSVHPPRATPPMWDGIFQTAKDNGLNMIEAYVFWNFHEREEGKYSWEERGNLSLFIERCAEHNLFVNLRIGPYVCAEWDYGGIPTWLGFKQGVEFRTYNSVWMKYMQNWFTTVINRLMPFFPKSGGPIVLVQVENELSAASGSEGQKYIDWCGKMANDAVRDSPVPIIMCNGDSAKDTINTCNGNDCTGFIEQHGQSGRILIDQPALWTENEGGFQIWGESPTNVTSYFWGRTASDISGAIAKWFARGGSHMNYYMFYGGNHYGPWTGSSITHMYASDVNICPDTFPHEPKFSHLGRLHRILASYADVIAYTPAQLGKEQHLLWFNNATQRFEPGTQQFAYTYKSGSRSITFIESDANVWVLTQYNGRNYDMPPYSVTLVDESGNELYNTHKVLPARTRRVTSAVTTQPFQWKVWSEPFGSQTKGYPSLPGAYPFEQSSAQHQLPGLWPSTQYLWYERNVTVVSQPSSSTALSFEAAYANGYVLFVDGQLAGVTDNHDHSDGTLVLTIQNVGRFFTKGTHTVTILSENFGFDNGMSAGSTRKVKGITGSIKLGSVDLTSGSWTMRPALIGEALQIFSTKGSSKVQWNNNWRAANGKPVTWFQTTFPKPNLAASEVLLFNATGMGRGHFYLNGKDLGRYWLINMNDGSGKPTQHLYHIPTDWLVDGVNIFTCAEILGASDASLPRLMKRRMVAGLGNSHDVTCPL